MTQPTLADEPLGGLPHRPPFVFLDKVIAHVPGQSAECAVSFREDNPVFTGHFPGAALVPGVLLVEAMAQTAGVAAATRKTGARRLMLSAIKRVKFTRTIRPGEVIQLSASKTGELGGTMQFTVSATVDGQPAAAGELVLTAAE